MTHDEVFDLVYQYFCSIFPLTCSCGRTYESLPEYIEQTKPVGPALSYDADDANPGSTQIIGSVAMANCDCGSTIALTTTDMMHDDRKKLLQWLVEESENRGVPSSDVLDQLRSEIREKAFNSTRPT